jgi:hypothetical protein
VVLSTASHYVFCALHCGRVLVGTQRWMTLLPASLTKCNYFRGGKSSKLLGRGAME